MHTPAPDPIDHDCLKKIANVLGQTCPYKLGRLQGVGHVPGAVRFTDLADGKRYEITVREVVTDGDDGRQPAGDEPLRELHAGVL